MKTSKKLIKYPVILLVFILLATLVMNLLYALPVSEMRRHASQSITMFYEDIIHNWCGDFEYTELATYTDSVMLNIAVTDTNEPSVKEAMLNPSVVNYGIEAEHNLIANLNNEAGLKYMNYARYWHGYLLYLKPLLLFFNVHDIQMIMLFVQLLLIVWVEILLAKRSGAFAMFFALVILLINPVTTVMSFQYADIIIISLMAMALILRERDMSKEKTALLFLVNGVAVAFFDLLTYPVAAIGIPLVTLLLVGEYSQKDAFNRVIISSTAWGAGYGIMLAGKWVMAYFLTGENVIKDGLERVIFRMGEESGPFSETVLSNFSYYFNRPIYVLIIISLIFIIAYLIKNKNKPFNRLICISPIVFVGLYPFFWFYFVRNHSITHPFLEFRSLSVSFWAVLAIVLKAKPDYDIEPGS